MKKFILPFALACIVLFTLQADTVQAQLNCTEPDLVALVFDNGDINTQAGLYHQVTARLVLLNPSNTAVWGFELSYESIPGLTVLSTTFPDNAINIGIGNSLIVGYNLPQYPVDNQIELCSFNFLVMTTDPTDLFLAPAEPSSISGSMVYLNHLENLISMAPISGNHDLPVARINGIQDLVYCSNNPPGDMTVQISALGDNNNLAGVADGALDGYDVTHDQVDSSSNPSVYFPHPEWNYAGGNNFQHDIKAPYDPLTEVKQWTFVVSVEIDNSGGAPVDVNLAFDPSFETNDGIAMQLRDQQTGQMMDLVYPYTYNYTLYSSNNRSFDLYIGTDAPSEDLELLIDVYNDQYSDVGNRAATQQDATDGYDAGLDIPEPAPAPTYYLTGSFYHTDWTMGPRFQSDVREPFDPLTEVKTWPFRVETDLSGSVTLDFNPSFDQSSGNLLMLKDMTSGQSYNLFPSLTYSYYPGYSGVRDFEITIGGESSPPPLSPTSRNLPEGWSMIGFPLVPLDGQASLGEVILNQAPGYAYSFLFEGDQGYSLQDAANPLVPGSGYWIATDTAFNWAYSGTIPTEPIDIALDDGWNLVANPLWFPAPIEGALVQYQGGTYSWAQAVTMGLLSSAVMDFDPNLGYFESTADLTAWNGYWIGAQVSGVTLTFDWQQFQVMPPRFSTPPVLDAPSTVSWQTDFVAMTEHAQHRVVSFGMNMEATAGFDPWQDLPLAPSSPAGGPRMGIQHPEWELSCGNLFASDYLQPTKEPVFWNIEFKNDQDGEVMLSWTNMDWPADQDFQLYIPSQNRVVVMSMREQSSISLPMTGGNLIVQVRTPNMMSGVDDIPGLKYNVSISPNPFNPQTTIAFTIEEPGDVELKIYTIRGERISSLKADGLAAGQHKMVWRGRDHAGRSVPSGAYFVKMYRNGQAVGSVKKMSLIR